MQVYVKIQSHMRRRATVCREGGPAPEKELPSSNANFTCQVPSAKVILPPPASGHDNPNPKHAYVHAPMIYI